MRTLWSLETPWAPYSVMFSNDGTRLAVGGGSWYGDGGVVITELETGAFCCTAARDLVATIPNQRSVPSIAGVYFSADDRHLAVATRGSGQRSSPSMLFAVEALELAHRSVIGHRCDDKMGGPFATGVQLAGSYIMTRHNGGSLVDCIVGHQTPPRLGCRADDRRQHLTHSRMVVRGGRVLTGGGGSLALVQWSADSGRREVGKVAEGLVSVPFMGGAAVEVVPVRACARVTAIAALPGEDGFLTGGLDGELDRWSGGQAPAQARLVVPAEELERASAPFVQPPAVAAAADSSWPPRPPPPSHPPIIWATYKPRSVVAICTLSDGQRWVSVDAGGRLRLWRGDALLAAWTLPTPGSPRCLAAHPTEPWIAVGIKQGGFARPTSAVLVLEC
jgi:hypothetical protein